MSDKKKMPANGGGVAKGKPDGVSGSPDTGEMGRVHGRTSGGESGGSAYPNPHSHVGKTHPDSAGGDFSGGQAEKAYYGDDNPDATTKPRNSHLVEADADQDSRTPVRDAHPVQAGGRTIEVIEDNGVAAAEATGKVATDATYRAEQESPGGG
jgi:hypothetical protein